MAAPTQVKVQSGQAATNLLLHSGFVAANQDLRDRYRTSQVESALARAQTNLKRRRLAQTRTQLQSAASWFAGISLVAAKGPTGATLLAKMRTQEVAVQEAETRAAEREETLEAQALAREELAARKQEEREQRKERARQLKTCKAKCLVACSHWRYRGSMGTCLLGCQTLCKEQHEY